MSNRTITDESVMQKRWNDLISDMEKAGIDCLLMHSTDRIYSSYLRYVTDSPISLYPMSGLFSGKGISLIGHGVKGVPLIPVPQMNIGMNTYAFHAGGVRMHSFVKDMIGVPACPTTNYIPNIWAEAIGELIEKYGYKRIGIVGMNTVPYGIVQYLKDNLKMVGFIDATALVDAEKVYKIRVRIASGRRVCSNY